MSKKFDLDAQKLQNLSNASKSDFERVKLKFKFRAKLSQTLETKVSYCKTL